MDITINKTNFVAAYGTLRRGWGNSRLIDKGDNLIGTGKTVNKYKMYSAGIPFVTKEPHTHITVDVWKVEEDNIPALDRLEGHPTWYKREIVPVKVDNNIYECWLYFNDTPRGTVVESGDYNQFNNDKW
jgi:gamma-glutamylaminecyclotransferase